MSSSLFIQWRKEMEWLVMPITLLMFENSFVKEFQFLRWARSGVSALVMRPSCEMDMERPIFCLVCTSGLWSKQTSEKFEFDPLFFSCSKYVAGSIRVFSVVSSIRGQSPVLLWGAASLSFSASELRSWHRYPPLSCRLRSATWLGFSCWWSSWEFSVSSLNRLWWIVCLGVITKTQLGRDNGSLCFFAQEGRTYAKPKLVSHFLDVSTFVRGGM